MCGGTTTTLAFVRPFPGLSPRVRGNRLRIGRLRVGRRSIPACAGEPGVSFYKPQRCAVYPRVCGGTRRSERGRGVRGGLSPRVRGNQGNVGAVYVGNGSIPAGAGEPASASG